MIALIEPVTRFIVRLVEQFHDVAKYSTPSAVKLLLPMNSIHSPATESQYIWTTDEWSVTVPSKQPMPAGIVADQPQYAGLLPGLASIVYVSVMPAISMSHRPHVPI